jgi:hypothetical protein
MRGVVVCGGLASTALPGAFPEGLPDTRTGEGLVLGFGGAPGAVVVVVVGPGWGRGAVVGAVFGRSPDAGSGFGLGMAFGGTGGVWVPTLLLEGGVLAWVCPACPAAAAKLSAPANRKSIPTARAARLG